MFHAELTEQDFHGIAVSGQGHTYRLTSSVLELSSFDLISNIYLHDNYNYSNSNSGTMGLSLKAYSNL